MGLRDGDGGGGDGVSSGGEEGGGEGEKKGKKKDNICYIKTKCGTNRDLLYSTGNYTQYHIITYREKNLKKSVYIYIYIHTHTHVYSGIVVLYT